MAWRIAPSVVRGEIDNRKRGIVQGKVWLEGRDEPLALHLSGNCSRDLAGCTVQFRNRAPVSTVDGHAGLLTEQSGTAGEITAARKARVFDVPLEEALQMGREGKKAPEHLANALYIEWFGEANGRVVVESADFEIQVSTPAWRLSANDEQEQIETTRAELRSWLDRMDSEEVDDPPPYDPDEDKPMDEFAYEQFMRESDARTDKYMELLEKYEGHPDCEKIVAREMGWEWLEEALEADERGALPEIEKSEPPPLDPNPATEGVDWIRDKNGRVRHPLANRAFESAISMWHFCDEGNLLGEEGDTDLRDMLFQFQTTAAKLAGALNSLAYDEDGSREGGFVVAALKRALNYLHKSIAAAEKVAPKKLLPIERMEAYRSELFEIREQVLALMKRYREM
jgi:hypothetical protein